MTDDTARTRARLQWDARRRRLDVNVVTGVAVDMDPAAFWQAAAQLQPGTAAEVKIRCGDSFITVRGDVLASQLHIAPRREP